MTAFLKFLKAEPKSPPIFLNLMVQKIRIIIAKIKEESEELIEASISDKEAIIHEAADLVFHVMVLLAFKDIDPSDILRELERREGVSGIEEKSKR